MTGYSDEVRRRRPLEFRNPNLVRFFVDLMKGNGGSARSTSPGANGLLEMNSRNSFASDIREVNTFVSGNKSASGAGVSQGTHFVV